VILTVLYTGYEYSFDRVCFTWSTV